MAKHSIPAHVLEHDFDPLLTVDEAASVLTIGKTAFRAGVKNGLFPRPINLGKALHRWPLSTLRRARAALVAANQDIAA